MKSLSQQEEKTVTREECLAIIRALEDTLVEFEKTLEHERDKAAYETRTAIKEAIKQEEKRFLGWLKKFLKEFADLTPAQGKLLDNLKYSEIEIKSWLHSVFEGQKYRADLLFKYSRRPIQQELFDNPAYQEKRNYTTKMHKTDNPRAYHY